MERGAKINLPCKSWRCEVPKAVVRPLIEREELCDSQSGAPSAGIPATPPNLGNSLAARRRSTDGRLSAAEGPAQPRGIAAVQQSGGDPAHVVAPRRPELTLSRTPTVLNRSGRHAYWRPMSSEEREMSTIARLQRETAEHRRLNEAMMPIAIAGTSQNMKRISIPLTRPINIQFPRNRPAGGHRESGSDPEYKLSHFIKDLRKYPPSTHSTRGCTMPRPFNLSCPRKRECDHAAVEQFISMAEYIDVFEHRTQPRGRKRARRPQETPDEQGGLRLKEDLENRKQ